MLKLFKRKKTPAIPGHIGLEQRMQRPMTRIGPGEKPQYLKPIVEIWKLDRRKKPAEKK